ncbi:hypothetical protein BDV36DRAFT_133141 [Aspergillus pseudocaelatus]|uniref:Ankyrin repeat-containing domain protein n=1 Tax=Aspergillus pseudocaelatus TaxID=1825620 RepID=A0ABQ6X5D7_9EURO|nr:hypothetical protein BDV36DRAFT_133141 [Aspergillus pseudocaelatus]
MDRWLSKDIIDPTRDVVQLLHGSAKDFLLGDNSLNMLFDSPEKKIKGNGHSYILLFAKAWLQLTQHQRKRLNCPFDVIMEVPFHAAQLESTLSTKDSALFFQTLDNIDHQLSTSHRGEQWPAEWFSRTVRNDIPSWNFTFRAFAVSMDMQGYIGYRLEQARNNHGQADFLNPKHGRPLLHFAVYLSGQPPKPEMTRMLLKSGADIKAQFDDKTAIQNPNSRYSPDTSYPNVWYPLLHIVAHLDDTIDLEARLDFMTFMCHAQGIDLNALDVAGRTLAEVLYWEDKTIPPQNWEILLGSGAKITKNMVSVHFHGLRYWEPGLETPQEISDNDHKSTESPEDESEQQSENRSDTGSTSSRTESEHRQLSLRLSAEHLSPDDCIIIASHARNYPSDAWKQTCTPTTSKKRKLRGLCEGYSHHNAYQVLRKPEFRRREWYTPEAAKAAEEIDPCWFLDYGRTHPKLNPIRTQSIMGSVLGPISEFIIGSFGT